MKKFSIVVSVFLALMLYNKVSGQNTSTVEGDASAQIVSPLQLTNSSDLAFGEIIGTQPGGTVIIDPVEDPDPHFSNPAAATNDPNVTSSTFNVIGIPNAVFLVALPKKDIRINSGSAKMKVTDFTCNLLNNHGIIATTGTQTFYVGGTLEVGHNQKVGDYSGTFEITIQYQ